MQLQAYLNKNKLSYADFAQILGLRGTAGYLRIWRYATDKRTPPPSTAYKIQEITNGKVTIKDFYGEVRQ